MPGRPNADNSTEWMIQARSRLARRRAEKPATKAGQIRALWPDIEAAIAAGQSMKTVCAWLAEDAGIALGLTSLTSYVSRIRRRERSSRYAPVPATLASDLMPADTHSTHAPLTSPPLQGRTIAIAPDAASKGDPLANYRAREGKHAGFNYRPPTVEDEKDLI